MNTLPKNTSGRPASDDEVAAHVRRILRDACLAADPKHALQLGLARRKALNAGARHSTVRVWAPIAGGMAACCALVIGLVWMRPFAPGATHSGANPAPIAAGDTGIATLDLGSGEVEVVQNLDFYRWLASQQGVPQASGTNAR